MLKDRVLVAQFLTHSIWIRYVKTIPILIVECCLRPPSWQGWIMFFDKVWNWSLSPITFSISLLNVFKRIIGLNIFEVLYEALLSLGIMIDVDVLKCDGQYPNSKHILSSLGVKSLLHLSIAKRNSCFENEGHSERGLFEISLIRVLSTCQYCAKLNISWRACQRSSILRHRLPLYLMASTTESFFFFTQFINSHRPFLLFKISWILLSKNSCLEILTIFLKFFQSFKSLELLYVSRAIWQLSFHHKFDCLVILTNFEYLNYISFISLCYDLRLGSGCNLDKDLRKGQE